MKEKTKLLIEMQLFPSAVTVSDDGTKHFDKYKFAQAIAKDCIYTMQLELLRNQHSPENSRTRKHIAKLADRYGITLTTDYESDWKIE